MTAYTCGHTTPDSPSSPPIARHLTVSCPSCLAKFRDANKESQDTKWRNGLGWHVLCIKAFEKDIKAYEEGRIDASAEEVQRWQRLVKYNHESIRETLQREQYAKTAVDKYWKEKWGV